MPTVEDQLRTYVGWVERTWPEQLEGVDTPGREIDPAGRNPWRARWALVGAAAAAVVLLIVGVLAFNGRNEGAELETGTHPTGASQAAIPLDEVDTESITAAIGSMTTIARHGDDILIVDGIATDGELAPWEPGAEPSTRVWVVDADQPERAQPYDLPSVGPRLYPQLVWWDGQWAIHGLRCPEPWDPADVKAEYEAQGEAHEPEECGSEVSDVFLFDPSTASVRAVGTAIEGRVSVRSVNGDRAVISHENGLRADGTNAVADLRLHELDGTVTDIDDLPGRGYWLIPAGDEFVALQVHSRGDYRGDLHDAADYWRLHRLSATEWLPEELPETEIEHRTNDGGAAGEDFILTEGRVGRASVNDPLPPETPLVLLTADATGAVAWDQVPVDGIPNPPDRVDLIDGQIIWSTPEGAWRWDGEAWVTTPFALLNEMTFVEDFTRLLHFEQTERWGPQTIMID